MCPRGLPLSADRPSDSVENYTYIIIIQMRISPQEQNQVKTKQHDLSDCRAIHTEKEFMQANLSGRRQWHPNSSTLAWKIPWMEEPGRLQSMGSLSRTRLRDFTFTFMHCRRKWQTTPVFLPGESQGRGSLLGCRLWGRTESDTTEAI